MGFRKFHWGFTDSRRIRESSRPGLHKFAAGWPDPRQIRDRFADSLQVRGFATDSHIPVGLPI
eukprot:454756-Prymnesium_polylepis.1